MPGVLLQLWWAVEDILVYAGFLVGVALYCGAFFLWTLGDDWGLATLYEVLWSPYLDPYIPAPTPANIEE